MYICEGNMTTVPAPGSSSIRCEKCCSIQQINKCETVLSAKIIVETNTLSENIHLFAFGSVIKEIAGKSICAVTDEDILNEERFDVTFNSRNAITCVSRPCKPEYRHQA